MSFQRCLALLVLVAAAMGAGCQPQPEFAPDGANAPTHSAVPSPTLAHSNCDITVTFPGVPGLLARPARIRDPNAYYFGLTEQVTRGLVLTYECLCEVGIRPDQITRSIAEFVVTRWLKERDIEMQSMSFAETPLGKRSIALGRTPSPWGNLSIVQHIYFSRACTIGVVVVRVQGASAGENTHWPGEHFLQSARRGNPDRPPIPPQSASLESGKGLRPVPSRSAIAY